MAHPILTLLDDRGQPRADLAEAAGAHATTPWLWLDRVGPVGGPLDTVLEALAGTSCEVLAHLTHPSWTDRDALASAVSRGLRAVRVTAEETEGAWQEVAATVHTLDHVRLEVDVPLTPRHAEDLGAIMAAAGEATVHLHGARPPTGPAVEPERVHPAMLAEALHVAWQAARDHHTQLQGHDLAGHHHVPSQGSQGAWTALHDTLAHGLDRPAPSLDGLPMVDPNLIRLLRTAVPLPWAEGGTRWGPDSDAAAADVGGPENLGRLLAAVGWPLADPPRCWGGLGARRREGPRCAACPGGDTCRGQHGAQPEVPPAHTPPPGTRVHVLIPHTGDAILAHATLPGLAEALEEAGAEVTVHTAWHAPTNPHGRALSSDGLPDSDDDARTWAVEHIKPWVRSLDLSTADVIVAPGWTWGDVALRHPRTPAHARIVLLDLHMLEGIKRWKNRYLGPGARSLGQHWWPDERVVVMSAFPGFARLHWYAGVPLRQVHWAPYPTSARHLPQGPDPLTAHHVFSGGAHLRDHATLVEALRQTGSGVPVRLLAPRNPARQPPARLRFEGSQPFATFVEALRTSRYVVLPLVPDADSASGLSVVALARAAGRPIIATSTVATRDHVRHEVDGLLVPPGDAEALAAAMQRLDHDDALLTRLAGGSRAAGARQDVTQMAAWILGTAAKHPDSGSRRVGG